MIIKIEEETPEVRKILAYLNTLSGVSVTSQERVNSEVKSVWDQAIAEGAVSVDDFINELKRQLKIHYNTALLSE